VLIARLGRHKVIRSQRVMSIWEDTGDPPGADLWGLDRTGIPKAQSAGATEQPDSRPLCRTAWGHAGAPAPSNSGPGV